MPFSFSSWVTIFDLVMIDSSMISSRILRFLDFIFLEFSCINLYSFLFPINAYLMTSPKPDLYSISGKVSKNLLLMRTRLGLLKEPTKFLPCLILIAVFPPTEEST